MSFKVYVERQEQQDYLDVLSSEFGIEPEQLAKIPQVASFVGFGDTYNLTPYEITGIERDAEGQVTGVKVKVMHDAASSTRKRYVKKDSGNYVQVDDDQEPSDQEFSIPINDILKLLTQGQDTQQQAGGLPGMPPGGPGGMM